MKSLPKQRDQSWYYYFHRDYGHDTEECYNLKNQIEDLIRRGHLNRCIRKPREPSPHPKGPMEKRIDVIGLTIPIDEVVTTTPGPIWMEKIHHYKKDETLPIDKAASRHVKRAEA
ncbi:hypothetical protein B296_00018274 [Ensete ventricosum]|uniref:Uncharacterized protein n=1 Tax=Ensete ventricosum TaxID=4639 RepID=A0A426Y2R7_ENSVE|nr:hypothetical protein B296_00018274 [Ensete ventricosum]